MILFEDDVKYDLWLKIILIASVLALVALGIMFFIDFQTKDILRDTPAGDSKIGAIVMFASAVFVLLVFRAVLPRKLYILPDRIRVKFGLFFYNIPFYAIESYARVKGIPLDEFDYDNIPWHKIYIEEQ